jgi:trimeric autotransporter adhesin
LHTFGDRQRRREIANVVAIVKGKFKVKKQKIRFTSILVALACFMFPGQMQAVTPPPDGCYPNFTTAEGCKALQSLTAGVGNTGIGWYSLFGNSTGSFNTAVGAGALDLNNADNNTAVGVAALLLNTTGIDNTATGVGALVFNNTGEGNTATGAFALYSNTEGDFNTANGEFTLYFNTIGERNTAIGDSALYLNSEGSRNTALGNTALLNNTAGNDNTANGFGALRNNTTGDENTATGVQALSSNTTGIVNTATGSQALASNTDGTSNTATGVDALHDTTSGGGNTADGFQALLHNDTGEYNTAQGLFALGGLTTGSNNTAVGRSAGTSVTTADHVICIGANVSIANVSNSCYIGEIFGVTSSGGSAVFINSSGKLGTATSSQRFKEEIKPMDKSSEAVLALKPVTFRYKKDVDSDGIPQFGLVAEDVEKVNPDLVVRDKEGKPYTVRYDQVNAMLLNEFLKQHRTVQAQQKEIDALKQELNDQKALIDKVTARIGLDTAGPQLVADKL